MLQFRQLIRYSLLLFIIFAIASSLGMFINPNSFLKLFFMPATLPSMTDISFSYYWDIAAYAEMALNNSCSAFYPLWPWLIKTLFEPQTIMVAAYKFQITALTIFIVTIPIVFWVFFLGFKNHLLALGISLVYTLSPFAIFRVNGYTEGLFSTLSLLLIGILLIQRELETYQQYKFLYFDKASSRFCLLLLPLDKLTSILFLKKFFNARSWLFISRTVMGIIIVLMSLVRPVLIQFISSSFLTITTLILFSLLTTNQGFTSPTNRMYHNIRFKYKQAFISSSLILVYSCIGYSIYGWFCWQRRGNFFAPFTDQSHWNKSFAFRAELLLFPRSPLVDLLGFYLPFLLFICGLIINFCYTEKKSLNLLVPKSPLWFFLLAYPPIFIVFYIIQDIFWNRKTVSHLFPIKNTSKFSYFVNKNFLLKFISCLRRIIPLEKVPTASQFSINQFLKNNYVFWICTYFALSHSLIAFLSQDRLVSLGRYIFAQPFIFFSLGWILISLYEYKFFKILMVLSAISFVGLIQQWVNYGDHKWLG